MPCGNTFHTKHSTTTLLFPASHFIQVLDEKLAWRYQTRRKRLNSALYLRLKKPFQNCKRRDPSGFLKIQIVAKNRKIWRGTLWRQKIRKKLNSAKKNSKRDPVVQSGFVSYVENWVHERRDCHAGSMIGITEIKWRFYTQTLNTITNGKNNSAKNDAVDYTASLETDT